MEQNLLIIYIITDNSFITTVHRQKALSQTSLPIHFKMKVFNLFVHLGDFNKIIFKNGLVCQVYGAVTLAVYLIRNVNA